MRTDARILYLYDPQIEASRIFADHLRSHLPGWDITIESPKLTTFLFEARKYNIVHLFFPLTSTKSSQFARKLAGKTKVIQTAIAIPEHVQKLDFSVDALIVSCEYDKKRIQQIRPDLNIQVIPPAVVLPDVNQLQHSREIKDKFEVGERTFAVALNDVSNKQHFDSFLYVIREFNRRGEFRFIVPQLKTDPETMKRRKELQKQIDAERLHSTTLLQEDFDMHSLLDSADIALHLSKSRDDHFDFPLTIVEASLIGKPVLCFDVSPYNEFISAFRKNWTFSTIEEMLSVARDIHRRSLDLEQLSTELARHARSVFSIERVTSLYRTAYQNILSSDVRVS
jgi:glycosyltransferase involved in cell wall biosynthesis